MIISFTPMTCMLDQVDDYHYWCLTVFRYPLGIYTDREREKIARVKQKFL